ncbi:uncharacterized protein [Coffea arabica]|uniref:Reverse transcriptase zinc-binding domain-containing protein n=1 Tax=Coffea arabica TaxID=13443 RepID=A0A6P6UIV1_COFAR
MTEAHCSLVRSILGFREQKLPFTYLGVLLFRGRATCALFDGLLSKMRHSLFHWSSKMLSMGGKIFLKHHVPCSLPIYWLQVLSPPGAVVASLGKICNAFLCDNSIETRRIHWTAWEKVCYPVGEAGLGFCSFEVVVDVFSCKLWWYLRENKTIWATYMHSKYIKSNHPSLVAVDCPSAIWHRLAKIRDLAEGNIRWSLGEGLVDFWHDRWCTDVPLAALVPGSARPHMLVEEFYRTSDWDKHRLRQLLPGHIVAQILKLRIFPGLKDMMVWGVSSMGKFSVASSWAHVRCKRALFSVYTLIWSSVVPLKVSFFTWRLLHRWVPLDRHL